jgi:peptidyl-tRNA hydrolase
MIEKLFVVTRADLAPGAICAQSVHAALSFAHAHPEIEEPWFRGSENLVVLAVADEPALMALARRAAADGVPCTLFREPDLGHAATSLALGHAGWRLVSSLPLALRPPKQRAA